MNRIEQLRQVVDDILRAQPDREEARCGFVHLYGVAQACALLARKRGIDMDLALAAGMLHDIWAYLVGPNPEHARLSAVEARRILDEQGTFTEDEVELVCEAIHKHSDKSYHEGDGPLVELIKDADALQHYLYNPGTFPPVHEWRKFPAGSRPSLEIARLERVLAELGIRANS